MTQKNIQSIPVVRASARDYGLAALVGDDAVILGWTMSDSIDRSDLLGFAIKRTRRDAITLHENESRWLGNHRRFAIRGEQQECSIVSSQTDPLQQFHFLDYDVECGSSYTYAMVPVRGTPSLKYFEAPVSVTVHPQHPWSHDVNVSEESQADGSSVQNVADLGLRRHAFVPSPAAQQVYRPMGNGDLALEIQRMTDQARSAVFLYSTVELPEHLTNVVSRINSGRLLYGLVPDGQIEQGRPKKTVHLSRPINDQKLEPLTFMNTGSADPLRYTSALVTDPWSRSPGILLWSDTPGVTPESVVDTRVITKDKRSAARLATSIFQAYASGQLSRSGSSNRRPLDDARNLEPDGRWSNIYFSRHAASHKFREREIFAGRP